MQSHRRLDMKAFITNIYTIVVIDLRYSTKPSYPLALQSLQPGEPTHQSVVYCTSVQPIYGECRIWFNFIHLFSFISSIYRNGIHNQFQVFHLSTLSRNQSMIGIMHQNKYHGDVMIWKRFKCYWFFERGIHSRRYIISKKASNSELWFFSVVRQKQLLMSRCRWFKTPWRLCDVTVMLLYQPVCQILTYSDVTWASKASTITVTPRVRSGNNRRQLDRSCYWHRKH